jgi:predicted flap endonuclease-1-like 5' DNA nuclease
MLGTLLRWAVRLLFFALIAGGIGFAITRLLGGDDEDFEDFEDLESSFEFNETPVEIDVSSAESAISSGIDTVADTVGEVVDDTAEEIGNTAGEIRDELSDSAEEISDAAGDIGDELGDELGDTAEAIGDEVGDEMEPRAGTSTGLLDEQSVDDTDNSEPSSYDGASHNGASDESRLIDIKGIGPGYESRLKSLGINSMTDLLNADSGQIAEQAGVIGGANTVEEWKERARAMVSEGRE